MVEEKVKKKYKVTLITSRKTERIVFAENEEKARSTIEHIYSKNDEEFISEVVEID